MFIMGDGYGYVGPCGTQLCAQKGNVSWCFGDEFSQCIHYTDSDECYFSQDLSCDNNWELADQCWYTEEFSCDDDGGGPNYTLITIMAIFCGVWLYKAGCHTGLALILCSRSFLRIAPLHEAAETGDIDAVKQLLASENGKNQLNKQTRYGETALILAAREGHVACVEALLEAGADTTLTCDVGFDALATNRFASRKGVAKTGASELQHTNALQNAATYGRLPCVLALLQTQSSAPANEVMPGHTFQNPLEEIQENQEPDEETQHHEQALKVACEAGHVAAAYFVSKAYGLDFGSAELTEVKQQLLTYYTKDGKSTWKILGGEQGTILPLAKTAVASACAGPQGRLWVRRASPLHRGAAVREMHYCSRDAFRRETHSSLLPG